MLVFGHAGVTLGAAILIDSALQSRQHQKSLLSNLSSRLISLVNRTDIRLLFIGSLFPDIIDKPIGVLFFRGIFSEGRLFCHTLLFLALVTIGGLYLYRRRRKNWLLVLTFGIFTHLILDLMWQEPQTLFWPVFGFNFGRVDLTNWLGDMLWELFHNPAVYIPETVGVIVAGWLGIILIQRRKLFAFVRHGKILL